MKKGYIKDLAKQKRYSEALHIIRYENYVTLFKEMLDFKKNLVEEDYSNLTYDKLSKLITKYYPEFTDEITIINVATDDPTNTYDKVINTYIEIYEYLEKNYKKSNNN